MTSRDLCQPKSFCHSVMRSKCLKHGKPKGMTDYYIRNSFSHRTMELLRLEEAFEIIESNQSIWMWVAAAIAPCCDGRG